MTSALVETLSFAKVDNESSLKFNDWTVTIGDY